MTIPLGANVQPTDDAVAKLHHDVADLVPAWRRPVLVLAGG